jgi:hypothetical protein
MRSLLLIDENLKFENSRAHSIAPGKTSSENVRLAWAVQTLHASLRAKRTVDMPIAVYCPECQKEYRVKDELAGRRVRCPQGHVLAVPELEAELDLDEPYEVEAAPAATMPPPREDHNPYASPRTDGSSHKTDAAPTLKVGLPAVTLIVLGFLGLGLSILSGIVAIVGEPAQVDPNAPPFVQAIQEGSRGPLAAVIQGVFVLVNGAIIVGAIQMLRFRSWGLAVTASILAMLNFGNCCCMLGLPVGIWSVVVLSLEDVRDAFRAAEG